MRVKNCTPFLHAARATSRKPPQVEMSLVVRGAFSLVAEGPLTLPEGEFEGDPRPQGMLSAHQFAIEEELMSEAICADDLVDFKLNAEVLYLGHCYAPGGKPAEQVPVRLRLGDLTKTLAVNGHRAWAGGALGAKIEGPEPFTELPMTWAHAFGGEGHAQNPAGKGADGLLLPNVEYPEEQVAKPSDKPRPASLGPINPLWEPRCGRYGTDYGATWEKTRAPWYAADFDWRYFSQAPADQQLEGYLRGDEPLALLNLSAEFASVKAKLPGLRVRAFVRRTGDAADSASEIGMVLDTVVVDGDAGLVFLTWRGLCKVAEDDLMDVETVLIASEPIEEARDAEDYVQQLLAFAADPIGLEGLEEQLAEADAAVAKLDGLEQATKTIGQNGDEGLPDDVEHLLLAADLSETEVATVKDPLTEAVQAPHRPTLVSPSHEPPATTRRAYPPPMKIPVEGEPLPIPPDRQRDEALEAALKATASAQSEADEALAAAGDPGATPVWGTKSPVSAIETLLDDPALKDLRGPARVTPAPGRDLSRQDLREADLRGVNLAGASLSEAQLGGADLRGANLKGCDLSHAVLVAANLDGADLSDTELRFTNLSEANATNVNLQGASFSWTILDDCTLYGANLSGCSGELSRFYRCNLTKASLVWANLREAGFYECSLEGADLSEAQLTSCAFLECRMPEARFVDARLNKSSFEKSDVSGARFVGAAGDAVVFLHSTLDEADLAWSVLPNAIFHHASLNEARLFGANLREARFYKTTLTGADLSRSNLMRADLRKAELSKANLRNANLFEAVLIDARGERTDFLNANLNRCRMPT